MNTLKAWLKPNLLTKDNSNDFIGVPMTNGTKEIADIVNELKKEGMEIKEETAPDIITRFNRKASELVTSGYNVNTGLVYMRPAIKGVFTDKNWNNDKNYLYVSITQGAELRKSISYTKVEILGEQASPMSIFSITDKATGKTNSLLTKGKNAEIKGTYIKIVGDNTANGIYLTNIDTKTTTKISVEDIVINEPSRLLILVPDSIDAGNYELSITTQYSGGNTTLKNPRTDNLNANITIP